jgi:hypothetical protein
LAGAGSVAGGLLRVLQVSRNTHCLRGSRIVSETLADGPAQPPLFLLLVISLLAFVIGITERERRGERGSIGAHWGGIVRPSAWAAGRGAR